MQWPRNDNEEKYVVHLYLMMDKTRINKYKTKILKYAFKIYDSCIRYTQIINLLSINH